MPLVDGLHVAITSRERYAFEHVCLLFFFFFSTFIVCFRVVDALRFVARAGFALFYLIEL